MSKSFIESLENRQLLSLVVDLRLPGGAKSATVSSVGQVVNLEIWAKATGADANGANEALQIVDGSLLSTNINGGAVNGNLKATLISPFNAAGSTEGAQKDLDGDGDLDVGSNDNSVATGFFFARDDTLNASGTVSGASQSWKVGTATFTVTSLKSTTGQTNLVWRIRNWISGALWREDGNAILKNGASGGYLAGSPLVIKRSGGTTVGGVSGKVFTDTNGDGLLSSGELGRSSVTVYLDKNKNGVKDSTEPSKLTDSNGNYSFTGLTSGSYRIRIQTPSTYRISTPSSGYYDVSVSSTTITGKNFGVTQRINITGKVWTDTNGDGFQNNGETNRSNVTVYLDKNKNGIKDSTEPTKVTDANGYYTFSGLTAGSYRVRIVNPSGYRISSPSSGYYDVSGSGAVFSSKNFGVTQRILISGRLWVDSDRDGVKDSTESVLSGWKVYIDKNKNGIFDTGDISTTTDSSGNYSFKTLTAGSYRVRVVQLSGYTRISPSSGYYDITLGNGGTTTNRNFRYTKP